MGFLSSSTSARNNYVDFVNVSFLVVVSFFLVFYLNPSANTADFESLTSTAETDCNALNRISDYRSKCVYLKSNNPCVNQGFVNYLSFLYCNFEEFPFLGQLLLLLWLLVLFYLLGDTASEYFCSSLESLSKVLNLSPTVAGVTLLSLGNGAPDVFASLVSFMGKNKGTYEIGLNTVLGGASFVTCVVVGIISISLRKKQVILEKSAFLRDICFFHLVIASLIAILVYGKINLWGALGFCSIYVVYVVVVYVSWKLSTKVHPDSIHKNDLTVPILEKAEIVCLEEGKLIDDRGETKTRHRNYCKLIFRIIEMPPFLPRRLTIPVASESKWSKPFAVVSVTLAPILLSILWNTHYDDMSFKMSLIVYGVGCFLGTILGFLAVFTTDAANPPKTCLLPWLVGGFVMSLTWSYVIAQELVALLTSLGYIYGVGPSILGLTILAWGNSLGDLITNLTMALHGGDKGAQVAVSGCYAGPIFNILFGLGLSMVGSAWKEYPSSIVIETDPSSLLETLGFLVAGLVWAVVLLPRNGMRLDGVLGAGLLVIYLLSLTVRLVQTIGSE